MRRGLSLIEIMIILAICCIIGAIVAGNLAKRRPATAEAVPAFPLAVVQPLGNLEGNFGPSMFIVTTEGGERTLVIYASYGISCRALSPLPTKTKE